MLKQQAAANATGLAPLESQTLRPQEAPPPDYYQNNLLNVCEAALAAHSDALRTQDQQWAARLIQAPAHAQRLYARLLMRKGPVFRLDKLAYDEIEDVDQAACVLGELSLATLGGEVPADLLLALMLKPELESVLGEKGRKADLVAHALGRYTDAQLRRLAGSRFNWLHLTGLDTVQRLQLLYFGRAHQDLSAFVLRDLGMVRYEPYPFDPSLAPFHERPEVDEYLRLRRLRWLVDALDEHPQWCDWLLAEAARNAERFDHHRALRRTRSRLLNTLGRWGERRTSPDFALACYEQSHLHPARERRVRVLAKLDEPAAQGLLAKISNDPLCGEEKVFAQRFGRRGAGYAPKTIVRALPDPDMVMTPGAIEACALDVLKEEGISGVHTENALPMTMTGLAYWDAIFAPIKGAFSNPMQNGPNDLFWDDFAKARTQVIAECSERLLADPGSLLNTYRAKHGTACALVAWGAVSEPLLELFVSTVPASHLVRLAEYAICNLPNARTGFPDLFTVGPDGRYAFVEVKGPNDALQPQQRVWFEALDGFGLPAHVLKFKAHSP